MAKILLSTVSGLPNPNNVPCFYEGFINALLREGNDVMLMITNQFIDEFWTKNKLKSMIDQQEVDSTIKNFNPDLVITFNHSLYNKIPKLVDCPIAVWGVDAAPMFAGKSGLKKNISRYQMICSTEDFYSSMKEYFGAKKDQLHTIEFATDFQAEPLDQTTSISFVGTNFVYTSQLEEYLFLNPQNNLKKFLDAFQTDVLKKPKTHLKELNIRDSMLASIPHSDFLNILSGNYRLQTLHNIHDLGLELYGTKNWHSVLAYSLGLAMCYNDKEISSAQDNQTLYNKSKIAINITHAQAGKAFGWRVRDAMATNACLVSDFREDFDRLFAKTVKIPTFQTPLEARSLCQKLLKDDVWRKEIVEGSQIAIEENHRFKHRLKDIENIFHLKLFNNKAGKLIQLYGEDFVRRENSRIRLENEKLKFELALYQRHAKRANRIFSLGMKYFPARLFHFIKKRIKM
jgi:hypothetical protein